MSLEQLQSGRRLVLRNAEELVRDAEVLYESQRWSRCLFCTQNAVEELGKYVMLVAATVDMIGEVIDWKVFWKRFRDHKAKFGNILLIEQFAERVFKVPGVRSWSEYLEVHNKHKKMNDHVKMMALYADFDGEEFYCPSELVGEKVADSLLQLVKQRLDSAKAFEHRVLKGGTSLERLTKERVHELWGTLGIEQIVKGSQ